MKSTMFGIVSLFVVLQSITVSWASITVPYIKPMLLGRTFDYSKSIVGNDIYPKEVWKNPLETNHYLTKVKYKVVRSAKDRREVLDISGHLSVQVMAGVVDFKGSGEYLKESFHTGNNVEVLAKIEFLTVTRSITDDKKPNPGWDKKPNIIGQHYVRSITYGGNLIASLKFSAKTEKDKKNLAIKVETKVKGKKFGVGVGGQFKQLAESVKDISTLSISFKATAPLVTVPTDIDSLVKAIKDFPQSVKSIDGGIGVPIEAELFELSQLSVSPKLQFLIDGAIQTRLTHLESMYFDLRRTLASLRTLLKRHPILSTKDEQAIGAFYGRIFGITEVFNDVITSIDMNFYSNKTNQFKKAFDAYRAGKILLPDKYTREYKALEATIEPVTTLSNGSALNNTQIKKRLAELTSQLESVNKTVVDLKKKSLAGLKSQLESVNKTVVYLKEIVLGLSSVKSCASLYKSGERIDGVYTVNPDGLGSFKVRCDMQTSGGGWTVFQRRQDSSVKFYRGWQDYKNGFGDLNGNFWLGLDKIHRLTKSGQNVLRVDLTDWKDDTAYAKYGSFSVASESDSYKLNVGGYSGNSGDSLKYHNGMKFTTYDRDNDQYGSENCAAVWKSAWWYKSCHYCNLNGRYLGAAARSFEGISWYDWKRDTRSMKKTEMKIRPAGF